MDWDEIGSLIVVFILTGLVAAGVGGGLYLAGNDQHPAPARDGQAQARAAPDTARAQEDVRRGRRGDVGCLASR